MKWVEYRGKIKGYLDVLVNCLGVKINIPNLYEINRPQSYLTVVRNGTETEVKGWDTTKLLWDILKERLDKLKTDLKIYESVHETDFESVDVWDDDYNG